MPTAADLKHRLTFHRPLGRDPLGGASGEFEEVFGDFCAIQYSPGGEGVVAARLKGQRPVILTFRASARSTEVAASWQCRRAGFRYEIKEHPSKHANDRRFLQALAIEVRDT